MTPAKARLGQDDESTWAEALRELDAALDGKKARYWHRVTYPKAAGREDVRELRAGLKLTQLQFAQALGASLSTVRAWEQGSRKPDGIARKVLHLLKARPDFLKVLAGV